MFFPRKAQNRYNQLSPNTHFYIALYSSFCAFIGITFTQEKNLCSLVLKLKVFYFRVFTGHTRRCIMRAALFFKNVPGTFISATHQVKAIAIGVSEVNPLVEIVSVFLFPSLNTYGNTVSANYIKRGIHPYLVSLYCNYFSLRYRVWQ